MPHEELKIPPENREALDPATDEQKEKIMEMVDKLLADKEYQKGILGGIEKGMYIELPSNQPVNILRSEKREDGLVAIINLMEWLGKKYGPRKITNYHIKLTPIDFQVEKKIHYDENEPLPHELSLEYLEGKIHEMDKAIEAGDLEKELGLWFFSQKDARDVIALLKKIQEFKQQEVSQHT